MFGVRCTLITKDADQRGWVEGILKVPQAAAIYDACLTIDLGVYFTEGGKPRRTQRKTLEAQQRQKH